MYPYVKETPLLSNGVTKNKIKVFVLDQMIAFGLRATTIYWPQRVAHE